MLRLPLRWSCALAAAAARCSPLLPLPLAAAPPLPSLALPAQQSLPLPAQSPLALRRAALHSSAPRRLAMRNVTGTTGAPRNLPPRPAAAATPPPPQWSQHAQSAPPHPHASASSPPPPPPPHSPGGGPSAPRPPFAPLNTARLTRLLLLLWAANIAVTLVALTPPQLSEEEQRRRQQERAAARALRWQSPQDDLQLRRLMRPVDERCAELQRSLLATPELAQASRPLLPFVAAVEVLLRLQVVAAQNRVVERRPLPEQTAADEQLHA